MATMHSPEATSALQDARAAARAGSYVEAAERCLGLIQGSAGGEAGALATCELARLAYFLRPTRGDRLPRLFADLPALLERSIGNSGLPAGMRARLVAARALVTAAQDPEQGLQAARDGLDFADTAGDSAARFTALFALHYGLEDPDFIADRRAVSRSMVEAAESGDDAEARVIAHWRAAIDAWVEGDSPLFDHHLDRFLAGAEDLGEAHWSTMATTFRGAHALYEGRYSDAEVEARKAMDSGLPAGTAAAAAQLGVIAVDQGRARDIEPRVMAMAAANRALYMPHRLGLASLLMAGGRFTEARAEVELTPLNELPRDASYLVALCLSADLRNYLQMGEATLDEVRERLEPHAGRNAVLGDAVACFGPVDLYLGCLAVARGDRAACRRHMESGYRSAARMRGRPWLARMSRDLADAFGDEGSGPGLDLAEETLAIAEELGMKQVAARARELLRAREPSQPPRPPEARFGKPLTPREAEIAAMLVEGKTARAIADDLILSTRTVQKHIEHIHEKLGVQTRHELMALAARGDLTR